MDRRRQGKSRFGHRAIGCTCDYNFTCRKCLEQVPPPNFVGMGEDEDPDAYDRARDRELTDGS